MPQLFRSSRCNRPSVAGSHRDLTPGLRALSCPRRSCLLSSSSQRCARLRSCPPPNRRFAAPARNVNPRPPHKCATPLMLSVCQRTVDSINVARDMRSWRSDSSLYAGDAGVDQQLGTEVRAPGRVFSRIIRPRRSPTLCLRRIALGYACGCSRAHRLSSLGERGRCAKVFSTLGLQSPVARARAIRPNNALQRTRASVVGLPGIPSCAKLISRAAEGERYTSEPVRLAPRINWLF
jgi:hypothetical protein